ncbi:MAG: GNAT family N-acetyltransferase [Candidatus Andersenbacteria bacterium]
MEAVFMKCQLASWRPPEVISPLQVISLTPGELVSDRRRYDQYRTIMRSCQEDGLFMNQGKHDAFFHCLLTKVFFTLAEDNLLISSALRVCIGPDCHVEYVMTHPKFRCRGAATNTVAALLAQSRYDRIHIARLYCDPAKVGFYTKLGFAAEETFCR